MGQEPRSLPWVTPPKYVGPGLLIIFFVAAALVAVFVIDERLNEAIITLLSAICFLLVGIADLLGELIMLTERKAQPPGS